MKKESRTRNWTAIVYPDSAPENWMELINDHHIQWICSPLHDKDKNADGTPKKPHWHIMLAYEGVKTFDQVKELTDSVNAPIPKKVDSARGLVRYMVHMDNPEKYQYAARDIKGFGGIDIEEYLKPISSGRYEMIKEMMEYIVESDVVEFEDLLTYASVEKFDTWFKLLCDNSAYVISMFIKSRRHRRQPLSSVRIVKVNEDGEVISNIE